MACMNDVTAVWVLGNGEGQPARANLIGQTLSYCCLTILCVSNALYTLERVMYALEIFDQNATLKG